MDENGVVNLPVVNGKWFTEMSMGKNILNYDSLFVLTHFKGHTQGGFGGSNKNIGIGCADGRIGKATVAYTHLDVYKRQIYACRSIDNRGAVGHQHCATHQIKKGEKK